MEKLIKAITIVLSAKEWDEAFNINLTHSLEARAELQRAKEKLIKLTNMKEVMKND